MELRKLPYAQAVYGRPEIDAVMAVLEGGPEKLMLGHNVAEMERRVAELFGKPLAVMCNSGSSALYLAVELLDLPPGSEVITSPIVFSTDLAPLVRAGLVPVFADVEYDTFQIDVRRIDEMIGPDTRAVLVPNLAGNAPDWDAIRQLAHRRGLRVIEDSCDAIGLTLRGTPTGTRADISVTSFAMAHHLTCAGTGGMVMVDDVALRDRCLVLRRWGRRSELFTFGSRQGEHNFWEDLDGVSYDNAFIFDEMGWNFEPNELTAAFGVKQLDRLPQSLARRRRNFDMLTEFLHRYPQYFIAPRTTPELDTVWMTYCFQVHPGSGFSRSELQEWLARWQIASRTVWTGNAARQPFMRDVKHRVPPGGLPNADRVMEYGMLLPSTPAMVDDDVAYICDVIEAFLASR